MTDTKNRAIMAMRVERFDNCSWLPHDKPEKPCPHCDGIAQRMLAALTAAGFSVVAKAAIAKLIAAYDEANPLRTADFHHTSCDCLRCAVDNLRAIAQPKVTP